MKIQVIPCLQDNYAYIIIDEENSTACVIDPSESEPVIDFLVKNNIELKYILNTHHHYDHVGGNKELKKEYAAKIIGYKGDKDRIPGIDFLVDDQDNWKQENPTNCATNDDTSLASNLTLLFSNPRPNVHAE